MPSFFYWQLGFCDEGGCSQEESKCVHLLMARVPAGRAWRRRCSLVMLRPRTAKTGASSYDNCGGGSNVNLFWRQGRKAKFVLRQGRKESGSAEHSVRTQGKNNSSCRGGCAKRARPGASGRIYKEAAGARAGWRVPPNRGVFSGTIFETKSCGEVWGLCVEFSTLTLFLLLLCRCVNLACTQLAPHRPGVRIWGM